MTRVTAAFHIGVLKRSLLRYRPDSELYTKSETELDKMLKLWSPFIRLLTRNSAWP